MTRDNDLNGLEHYERFLDAQRFEPGPPMTANKKGTPMAFDDLGKGLAAVCNPMTRDKTTNPGAPMSKEITRERYDRARQALMLATTDRDFHKSEFGWSPIYADAGKAVALVEELDRLRSAAGEVERMREALEKIAANNGERSGECQYIARRALAGSET